MHNNTNEPISNATMWPRNPWQDVDQCHTIVLDPRKTFRPEYQAFQPKRSKLLYKAQSTHDPLSTGSDCHHHQVVVALLRQQAHPHACKHRIKNNQQSSHSSVSNKRSTRGSGMIRKIGLTLTVAA
jgi:hypothetical protein